MLGIKDAIKGEVPCGFLVLKAGVSRSHAEIEKEIVALVREKLGPVAAFKLAITVARLPKTRSGKILRGTIKKIADGDTWTMYARLEPGNKLAARPIAVGERVLKYGFPIGTATEPIEVGSHVHLHNLRSDHIPIEIEVGDGEHTN